MTKRTKPKDWPAEVLQAYALAELEKLKGQPRICWQCGAEVSEEAEVCPECGVDLVPF